MNRAISHGFRLSILAALAAACVSCASIQRVDDLEARMRRDQVRFYEKMSDAYFMLGYEYYTLAAEAENAKLPESRVRDLKTRARVYTLFQQDLQKAAAELRREAEAANPPAAPPASRPAAQGTPPEPSTMPPRQAPTTWPAP